MSLYATFNLLERRRSLPSYSKHYVFQSRRMKLLLVYRHVAPLDVVQSSELHEIFIKITDMFIYEDKRLKGQET